MTIKVTLPDAWQAFTAEARTKDGTHHEQCWDVVGEPLNGAVRETVAEYYEKLELGDKHVATSKRAEILDLYWGRIEQDGAAIRGLGKALASLSATIKANVDELGAHWSGESFESFSTAMGKIRTTLDAYSAAAGKVGDVLLEAMTQARAMYADYAAASQETLTFTWISPPEQWRKLDSGSGDRLAEVCPDSAGHPCQKDNDEQKQILENHFVTDRLWDSCAADPCDANAGRVIIMYRNLVKAGDEGRDAIRERVDQWRDATDAFKENIKSLLEVAVGNLYALAQSQAFSSLRVVGGAAGGGEPVGGEPVSGEPVGGGPVSGEPVSGGGDVSGGAPGDGGAVSAEPIVDPVTAPEPEPVPEPAAEVADPATVTITDGDHTIGVSNPGVEGHVTVTVTDAEGTTKTYDLDFGAASGLAQPGDGEPAAEGVERVPARTDGKCVIQDGDVTVTAERPLFAPDQITLTVDHGTGAPAKYTVDFPDVPEVGADSPTDQGSAGTDPVSQGPMAADPVGQAPVGQSPMVTDSGGQARAAGQETQAPGRPVVEPVAAGADPVAGAATPVPGETADVKAHHLTSPQAWTQEARGSVSGVLVPEQSDGEAGLASAPDAARPQREDATGMAGAGVPLMGGPGASGSEPGRAGSGWSVHGDLFDSGEPVYSMHGVLGDDDAERTDR